LAAAAESALNAGALSNPPSGAFNLTLKRRGSFKAAKADAQSDARKRSKPLVGASRFYDMEAPVRPLIHARRRDLRGQTNGDACGNAQRPSGESALRIFMTRERLSDCFHALRRVILNGARF
jgi:hypothetical protein